MGGVLSHRQAHSLERKPDQTRPVNCQTSAGHRINGNDFTASLGIMAQHPRARSQSLITLEGQGLQSSGHKSWGWGEALVGLNSTRPTGEGGSSEQDPLGARFLSPICLSGRQTS